MSKETRTFDVSSEHDLLSLLQFIRRGPFETEQKSALRDAVLDYAASKDDAVLTDIAAALAAQNVMLQQNGQAVATSTVEKSGPAQSQETKAVATAESGVQGLGMRRPAPSFGAPTQTAPTAKTPAPKQERVATDQKPQTTDAPRSVPVRSVSDTKTEDRQDAEASAPTKAPKTENTNTQPAAPSDIPPMPQPTQAGKENAAPAEAQQPTAIPEPQTSTAQKDAAASGSAPPEPASAAPQRQEQAVPSAPSATANETPQQAQQPQPEQAQAEQQAPSAAPASAKEPLERIKEIKQLINAKVGNPVNLIDANNEIGREYMNALLNAMRVVGAGNGEDTKLAMDRLEKAYASVEQSIESGETVIGEKQNATTQHVPAAPQSDAEPTSQSQMPVSPATSSIPSTDSPSAIPAGNATPPPTTQQAAQPASQAPPQPVQSQPKQEPPADSAPAAPTPTAPPQPAAAEQKTTEAPQPSPELQSQSSRAQEPPPPQRSSMQKLAEDVKLPQKNSNAAAPHQTENQAAGTEQPQSIAEKLKQKQASQESLLKKRANELELQQEQQSSDPLHSNAVSAGLQQLLSEWKLFKSSGIFGTGPSGFEHPLYKQLSALPMSAIIAGRFEGATPEIKQSITDYMNGWRYEQGIVHEMNETFEHYLRRVVKEILDKQKAPKA